jgi:hypothetical protein
MTQSQHPTTKNASSVPSLTASEFSSLLANTTDKQQFNVAWSLGVAQAKGGAFPAEWGCVLLMLKEILTNQKSIMAAVVPGPVASLTISLKEEEPMGLSINIGTNPGPTFQFTYVAKDPSGKTVTDPNAITWASDTPTVATVDNTGLATFVGLGTANLTVTDGTLTSTPFPLTFTDRPSELDIVPPAGLNP